MSETTEQFIGMLFDNLSTIFKLKFKISFDKFGLYFSQILDFVFQGFCCWCWNICQFSVLFIVVLIYEAQNLKRHPYAIIWIIWDTSWSLLFIHFYSKWNCMLYFIQMPNPVHRPVALPQDSWVDLIFKIDLDVFIRMAIKRGQRLNLYPGVTRYLYNFRYICIK